MLQVGDPHLSTGPWTGGTPPKGMPAPRQISAYDQDAGRAGLYIVGGTFFLIFFGPLILRKLCWIASLF